MNHLEELEILNYQSWKFCLLEFSPGVNVILGSSDKGKSSIVRALNWVCSNRPTGNDFRSNFTKSDTSVTLCMDDSIVCRKKGNKTNVYNLNDSAQNLQALRSDIPDEVKQLTRMESINIQPQHENYFLLNDTPGQVAKKFNEIAGLKIMDKSLLAINSEIRELNQEVKTTDATIETLETKIKKLDWLSSCEKDLLIIERMEEQIHEISYTIDVIGLLETKYREMQEEIDKLPSPDALPLVEDILDKDDELYETEQNLKNINQLLVQQSELDHEIKRLSLFKNVKLSSPDAVRSSIGRLDESIKSMSDLINRFDNITSDLLDIKPQIKIAEDSLADFKCETKFCPTCNNPWEGHSNG